MDTSRTVAPSAGDTASADAAGGVCPPDCPVPTQPTVDPASEAPGYAAYNPFATTGIVVQVPAAEPIAAPGPPAGDWPLPVAVTLVGFAFIGWMMRAMLQ